MISENGECCISSLSVVRNSTSSDCVAVRFRIPHVLIFLLSRNKVNKLNRSSVDNAKILIHCIKCESQDYILHVYCVQLYKLLYCHTLKWKY